MPGERDRPLGRRGDHADQQTEGDDRHAPAREGAAHQAQGQAERPKEQARVRPRAAAVGQGGGAEVAPAGQNDGQPGEHRDEGGDGQQRQRVRPGERPQLLDPAEGSRPAQPVEAHSGVGHHAQRVARPQDGAGIGGRLAAGGGELPGEGAHGEEHDGARHQGEREEQGGAHSDADPRRLPDDRDDERGQHPQHGGAGGQAGERLGGRRPAGRLAGQQQLPASGVFFAAQQLCASQQSPCRANQIDEGEVLPGGEAGDRLQPVGRPHERAQAHVRTEELRQVGALRGRLVARRVGVGPHRHVGAEDVAPQHGAAHGAPRRAPRDQRGRRAAGRRRRRGDGRRRRRHDRVSLHGPAGRPSFLPRPARHPQPDRPAPRRPERARRRARRPRARPRRSARGTALRARAHG